MILLDTSALFYWTLDPDGLTSHAKEAIRESDKILVNAISLWELSLKVQRGKLYLPVTIRELVTRLQKVDDLIIQPTDVDIWIHSVELDWSHWDPADRVIVAAADLLGCPLVTSDRRIRAFYSLAVW